MKAFFRFLRGELNGYYIQRLNEVNNVFSESVKSFLTYFARMQFKTEADVEGNEVPINNYMIKGIGAISGAFPPYVMQESLASALRFTGSHIVNGKEYSVSEKSIIIFSGHCAAGCLCNTGLCLRW